MGVRHVLYGLNQYEVKIVHEVVGPPVIPIGQWCKRYLHGADDRPLYEWWFPYMETKRFDICVMIWLRWG